MEHKITDVQIVPIKPNNWLIAIASVILNKSLYLWWIWVHTRLNWEWIRLTYPTRKVWDRDVSLYHPIIAQTWKLIEYAVSEKYKELLGNK